MLQRSLVLAIACAVALPAFAADERTALTLYRADGDQLFSTGGDAVSGDGYAVVHERRAFDLKGGTQDLSIDGLPAALDSEALSLRFPGKETRVVSQRLLLGQGFDGAVAGLVGHNISVIGESGQPIASGTLVRGGDALVVREANGQATLVRQYAALRAADSKDFARGSTLQVRVAGSGAGHANAQLDYPTSGLGWRGAYVATLQPGHACRMTFDAAASIANRSGRDWEDVTLKLVAGEARRAKTPPQPRMFDRGMVAAMAKAPERTPAQATLGDLRTYTLPAAVDLPDGSVTQTPLYDRRTLDCERQALYDSQAGGWFPPRPNMERQTVPPADGVPIVSNLRFKAFDSLPAGYVRVLTTDRDGNAELLGEGRIDDTPKNQDTTVSLGNAFDLSARREQTAFTADADAHRIDEAFRIVLSNAGDTARTITVHEHPNRWRAWKVASSSLKPTKVSPELLEFKVEVPANGSATLDYAVQYTWIDADLPK
ncbi:DUF4139 domain-containing protein [Luteibacter yeojuensis]|uniref:DUF4139 domain-containing protein n=1 Tax=Luteibacter yeojuensis TaxID=345309 RepID=A0A7X5QU70_9GAMM|nr:DUF4139 domain-containing protein [Luteibacter yeojuensis]NID15488.1 DUF4139 domain-containing protein [Luteibacter yeojuensis]